MGLDALTDSKSIFPGLTFNALGDVELTAEMGWFASVAGFVGGGAVTEVVVVVAFLFAKYPETETTFFLEGLKGEARSQGPNCWSSEFRPPSLSIQVAQSLSSCVRQPHQ